MRPLNVAARRGWRPILANCSLAIGVIAFPGCSSPPPAIEQPTPQVAVAKVVSREIVDTDEYTGRTEASEIVEVRSRIFGFLKAIDFKDGDFVQAGQTLFTIEPDEYQAIHEQSLAQIAVNQANLELARSKLAMKERLLPNGAISQEEYNEAVAAVHEAEATIAAARADANRTAVDLKYTEIKAPISGRIDRTLVNPYHPYNRTTATVRPIPTSFVPVNQHLVIQGRDGSSGGPHTGRIPVRLCTTRT